MQNNYPIKYAAMPVIEQVGWSHGLHELERDYGVVCYIASKCYLVSDTMKYTRDGRSEREYKVVFAYQKRDSCFERVTPSSCTHFDVVGEVFDTYQEALDMATLKNKKLCNKNCSYVSVSEIPKTIEEFYDKLSRYKRLEQLILARTSDLDPSHVKKLNELIMYDGGKTNVSSADLYGYLNLSRSHFIVYSVSPELYNNWMASICSKNMLDISKMIESSTPILYHEAGDENIMVTHPNGSVLYYIDKWKRLINNDEQKIPPTLLSVINDQVEIIFTTETLEDMVLSFQEQKDISVDELRGPVLQKNLSNQK